ncbi:hypothetical protein [Pseudomonas sp.]|uniref:hypothetical protein n=1 Tax=Pseudomonas sp. TaxID=306 RepID=UPI002620F914|nr:hypothetical protein [Pseudomonas sp.]
MNTKPSNNVIALVCIIVGALMTLLIFFESRLDPGLRMAALVFASNISTAIVAISSLLLTGKDLTGKHDPADLPPGGVQTDSTTVQVPPVAPLDGTK